MWLSSQLRSTPKLPLTGNLYSTFLYCGTVLHFCTTPVLCAKIACTIRILLWACYLHFLRLIWIQLLLFLTSINNTNRLQDHLIIIHWLWVFFIFTCFRAIIFFIADTRKLLLRVADSLLLAPQVSAFGPLGNSFHFSFAFGWSSSILNHLLTGVISRFSRSIALSARLSLLSQGQQFHRMWLSMQSLQLNSLKVMKLRCIYVAKLR